MNTQTSRNPSERTFVVRFEPLSETRGRLRGRVELVASDETMRFRSAKQLVGFMADVLRREAVSEESQDGSD